MAAAPVRGALVALLALVPLVAGQGARGVPVTQITLAMNTGGTSPDWCSECCGQPSSRP
jgi:hypothetical protein